jgi:hypothetical protein
MCVTEFVRVPQRPAMFEATDAEGRVFAITNTSDAGGLEVAFCRAVPPLRSQQLLELAHFVGLLERELEDQRAPAHLLSCPRVRVRFDWKDGRRGFTVVPGDRGRQTCR